MIILGPLGLILIGGIIVIVALIARSSRSPGATISAADQQRAIAERIRAIDAADRALAAWKADPSETNLAALDSANARLRATSERSTPEGPPSPPPQDDPIDQIRRLAELRDQGAITSEEFEAKKRDLLGKIT